MRRLLIQQCHGPELQAQSLYPTRFDPSWILGLYDRVRMHPGLIRQIHGRGARLTIVMEWIGMRNIQAGYYKSWTWSLEVFCIIAPKQDR